MKIRPYRVCDICGEEYHKTHNCMKVKILIDPMRYTEMYGDLPIMSKWDICPKCSEDLMSELMLKVADRKTENNSEKPNNCEHITEDGVTCAKYPACDDCLDNPLNKVKGSERLVKGKDEPTISKMEQVEEPMKTTDYCDICKRDMCEGCVADATNPYCVPSHYEINYEPKDEPQTDCDHKCIQTEIGCEKTDCPWK